VQVGATVFGITEVEDVGHAAHDGEVGRVGASGWVVFVGEGGEERRE